MSETILKSRRWSLVDDNGYRLDVVAKLASLGSQEPYFSVTSQRGSNHDEILAVAPELTPVVRMHLCTKGGVPMHGLANLVYHLRNGDFDKARAHVCDAASIDDLILVAGKAAMASRQDVLDENMELAARLKEQKARLLDLEKNELNTARFFAKGGSKAKADLTESIKTLTDRLMPKGINKAEMKAYEGHIRTYMNDTLLPVWRSLSVEAEGVLDGPDVVAENYIPLEDDASSFAGFARYYGLTLEAVKNFKLSEYSPPKGEYRRFSWDCALVTADGFRMEFPYSFGNPDDKPSVERVLESLAMEAQSGAGDFKNFCDECGFDKDSRSAYATWEACVEIKGKLCDLIGEEAVQFLMYEVSEDGTGATPPEAQPSIKSPAP